MLVNPREVLAPLAAEAGISSERLQLPDILLAPESIRVLLISETPPPDPADGFYSAAPHPADFESVRRLFADAGLEVCSVQELTGRGIYLTTALKLPKKGAAVEAAELEQALPLLERELDLFPHLRVVMLMGDVAKKAFNRIAKKRTGKSVIPSGSTYKLRNQAFYWGGIRVFPSYIVTGGNILIEKSKREMIADDLGRMLALL